MTRSRGRSLALGDRLAVSVATAKRIPSAKDSFLTPDARTFRHSLMGTCCSVVIRMELARLRDQIIPLWLYPSGADVGSETIVNQKQHQPSRTRWNRRSYPKWVGVGFHIFRGAACSGRETKHNPPSVKGRVETSYRRYCRLRCQKIGRPRAAAGSNFRASATPGMV